MKPLSEGVAGIKFHVSRTHTDWSIVSLRKVNVSYQPLQVFGDGSHELWVVSLLVEGGCVAVGQRHCEPKARGADRVPIKRP